MAQVFLDGRSVSDTAFAQPDQNSAFLFALPASFMGGEEAFWGSESATAGSGPGGDSSKSRTRKKEYFRDIDYRDHDILAAAALLALYLDEE